MNNKTVFWGIFFITIGALILLNNFTPLEFNWGYVWKFWPALFIVWGLAIITRKTSYRWIMSLAGAFLAALLIFAAVKNSFIVFDREVIDEVFDGHSGHTSFEYDEDGSFDDSDTSSVISSEDEVNVFSKPMPSNVSKGHLSFNARAGIIKMLPPVRDLVVIETKGTVARYRFEPRIENDRADISFSMEKSHIKIRKGMKNNIEVALNTAPLWDMDFDIGAAYAELDLSRYRTENIKFHSGASSVKLKLGNLSKYSRLNFDSGVSKVEISVPRSSGCQIKVDNHLSAKDFENFKKTGDKTYRTDNYQSAGSRIDIELEAGVSAIKVEQY